MQFYGEFRRENSFQFVCSGQYFNYTSQQQKSIIVPNATDAFVNASQ